MCSYTDPPDGWIENNLILDEFCVWLSDGILCDDYDCSLYFLYLTFGSVCK